MRTSLGAPKILRFTHPICNSRQCWSNGRVERQFHRLKLLRLTEIGESHFHSAVDMNAAIERIVGHKNRPDPGKQRREARLAI